MKKLGFLVNLDSCGTFGDKVTEFEKSVVNRVDDFLRQHNHRVKNNQYYIYGKLYYTDVDENSDVALLLRVTFNDIDIVPVDDINSPELI